MLIYNSKTYFLKLIYSFFLALVFSVGTAFAFTVTMDAKSDGTAKPTIIGETNLPDKTVLMFTLENKKLDYIAQTKVAVKDGKFETSPFSNRGANIEKGTYQLNVTMGIPAVQDKAVQAILGEKGENISGPLVKSAESFKSKSVSYKTTIQVK